MPYVNIDDSFSNPSGTGDIDNAYDWAGFLSNRSSGSRYTLNSITFESDNK